jgi:acylphosphatase
VWRQVQRLELAGWVRNRHDGTVEVLADATSDEHEKLLQVLGQGPSLSRVDRVEAETEAREIEDLVGFAVVPDA